MEMLRFNCISISYYNLVFKKFYKKLYTNIVPSDTILEDTKKKGDSNAYKN